MKITAIDNTKLRNEEHYQFQTDFKGLVEKNTPAALSIAMHSPPILSFRICINDLKLAYKAPAKTIITD